MSFDDSTVFGFKRALINAKVKEFFNARAIDPLAYWGKGESGRDMRSAIEQSMCWMISGDWSKYRTIPGNGRQVCLWTKGEKAEASEFSTPNVWTARERHVDNDNYVIVTFSLGSRMVVDGFARIKELINERRADPVLKKLRAAMSNKEITIFMLANQLPLIHEGILQESLPIGDLRKFCEKSNKRWLKSLSVVAVTDPNDLLSYPLPTHIPTKFVDKEFCPKFSNVIINIAKEITFLEYLNFADPLTAHTDYDKDKRVTELIVYGSAATALHIKNDKESGNAEISGKTGVKMTGLQQNSGVAINQQTGSANLKCSGGPFIIK